MIPNGEDNTEFLDDGDMLFDAASNIEIDDDPTVEVVNRQSIETARRKIERRKESAWLRDQLNDWDGWDD